MPRTTDTIEKRQFGRRKVLWHGWVKVPGRDRETCIVRNFSLAGALLEFDSVPPSADKFSLSIDAYNFSVECYVRHRSKTGIGVFFAEPEEGVWPRGRVSPQQMVDMIEASRA